MTSLAGWPWISAVQQLQALRQGECSSVELVQATLERLDRLHPRINAVVVRDDERALETARAMDAERTAGRSRPLLGLPMTVKESFAVAGLPTTMGNPANTGPIAAQDAHAVALLKEAGAVILGKSNVPLNNGDIQTFNDVYGLTRNPWNGERTPGGSSGGSAAAVAAGFAALELGSDIGGSVRIPAHFCGVAALKPTWGIIDDRGSGLPQSRLAPRDIASVGPVARSAEDLDLMLSVLAGPAPEDACAWALNLPAPRATRLRDFRVLLLDSHPLVAPSTASQALSDQLKDGLRQAGVNFHGATSHPAAGLLPDLVELHTVYQKLAIGSALATRPESFIRETQEAIARLDPDDNSYAATRVRSGMISHWDWLRANEARRHFRAQWTRLFEQYDVVLMPTSVTPAFRHDHSMPRDARHVNVDGHDYRYLELFIWIGIASQSGFPSVTFPVGLWQGLPQGAQAMGPWLGDRTALAFAQAWKREVGGYAVPPGLK